ncbi:recombinase [Streptococcus agalactiae LMG 14747]|uniref:Recombinase n=2 Tax=Streptococcus TaxID=1301 RepID=V6Z1R1_STRAG|nr:SP_0009 family protein [Streptococcus acidominimus]ESV54792.1 recombinase [Streptococcus agalactiae LMG 14747]SNV31530.1 putative extracellular protein [Streptococcus acidominimus]
MENLIETIETFLKYSDDKLEELSQKNQALRQEREEEGT